VLAYDINRPPLDLTARQAARGVAGDIRSWRELGRPGGPLEVGRGAAGRRQLRRDEPVLAVMPASRTPAYAQVASIGGVDPLTRPGQYPLRLRSRTERPRVTTMTLVGDIMLGRGVAAANPGDPGAALAPLRRRLAAADVTVGNLESTLSDDGAPRQGDDSFAADPAVVDDLAAAGFDVLSLANNHTGDYGPSALRTTVRLLGDSPIRGVGAGRNARAAWRPVVVEHAGQTFGFVAFNAIGETPRATTTRPGVAEVRMRPRTGPLSAADLARVSGVVERLARRVDAVVVLPHWGTQYTSQPVLDQRRVGRALVDAGADIVVGGHPHWVQGIQLRRGRPVVHSLGNFVFDMDFSARTMQGVLLDLVFWDGELRGCRFTPYALDDAFAPRLVGPARGRRIAEPMWRASDPPYRP
jgi:poly-gamma-glutamate synthesis protein (capsule biosynthesis protein)